MLNSAPDLLEDLQAQFGAKVLGSQSQTGRSVLMIEPSAWAEVIGWLKAERGFDFIGTPRRFIGPARVSIGRRANSDAQNRPAWLYRRKIVFFFSRTSDS